MQFAATHTTISPHEQPVADLLGRGYHALQAGDRALAEAYFRRAVQLDPRSAAAWSALAETQRGARQAICLRWAALAEHAAARSDPFHRPTPTARPLLSRRARPLLVSAIGVAASLTLLLIGSDLLYRERLLPGISAGPLSLGNRPVAAVEADLRRRERLAEQRMIQISAGERRWRVPLGTLLRDQADAVAATAQAYGHEPDFWQRATTRTRALLGQQLVIELAPVEQAAVAQVADAIQHEIDRPRHDAQVLRTEQGWAILPEQRGQRIDRAGLVAGLARLAAEHAWSDQTTPLALEVAVRHEPPQRTAAQLEPLLVELQRLAAQPLELTSGEQRWTLDRSLLMQIDTAAETPLLRPGTAAISRYLSELAPQLAAPPQPSQLVREGDRIRALTLGRAGRELDQDRAVQQIAQALATGAPGVELPLRELPPPPGEAEQLGLIAELGRGQSQFLTYSSPERDANVAAGGHDIDGVLVAPGEVFSFTATVGEITWEKGYRWGEMIEAGSVVPSLGGGICQVSTTAFRAAFWSGLEIVERHHHSWRLPWYEVDAPPGMDATIALGGPDLKFRNTTDHFILIKVETDLINKQQTVIIYGTPDGRRVEMQPMAGGNIGIGRHVIQGTQVVEDDTFMSYYTQ